MTDTRQRLIDLMDKIDKRLPDCSDSEYMTVADIPIDDVVRLVKTGRLVLVRRGMFRRIRNELERNEK